jgi:hypothetical protein
MIIYEFTTTGAKHGNLFTVNTLQMTEKPHIYMGGGRRINKADIGVLFTNFGRKMYLLDDNPEPYISAMIEYCKNEVEKCEHRLRQAKSLLAKWKGGAE